MIGSDGAFTIGQASADDSPQLLELIDARPPAYWMRKVSRRSLEIFLNYARESPRAVFLVARPRTGEPLGGYVFAVIDARRFWLEFALRNPAIAQTIFVHRILRSFELQRELRDRAPQGDSLDAVPAFSWSSSHPRAARIIGLFVRPEHEGKGISMSLYLELCPALKEKGVDSVEEYMQPGLSPTAEKFFALCGWEIQPCRLGYKLSKRL